MPLERKFPIIRDVVEELKLHSTILDGEIVALDEEGIPRFQLLHKSQKRPTAPVVYRRERMRFSVLELGR